MCDLLRGRELDRAIATEVYGGSVNEHDWWFWDGADIQLPKFHEDDDVCMAVVDDMVRRGCEMTLEDHGKVGWRCRYWYSRFYGNTMSDVLDDDRRVATLNAALRAARKEQGDG